MTRKVHRFLPHVTREYILRLARLANYYFLQADKCLVFLNLTAQDCTVKSARHGDYFRVVETSTLDTSVSTESALNFAMTIDDEEAARVVECTSRPRRHRSLALAAPLSRRRVTDPFDDMEGSSSTRQCGTANDVEVHHLNLQRPERRNKETSRHEDELPKSLSQLRNSSDEDGFVECLEEGQTAYMSTWYISHVHSPRCAESTPVRLDDNEDQWESQILAAWNDLVDEGSPIVFHVVKPCPPRTQTESTLLHVLVEQHNHIATHSAGVFSVIRKDGSHAAVYHVALPGWRQSGLSCIN